jgi:drug/metabolite transporter (DMT)-like permease
LTLLGCLFTLPFAPGLADAARTAPAADLAWMAYLGVFPTALAFTTWAFALARTAAGRMAATTYLVPPLATLIGWAWLGEVPAAGAFAGGGLALLGVAVARGVVRLPRRRTAAVAG